MKANAIGALLAGLAALVTTYEFLAILTPLPTISREWQGLRDTSAIAADVLGVLAVAIGLSVVVFAGWLVKHFIRDHRSTL
jgi:hypothetical protein